VESIICYLLLTLLHFNCFVEIWLLIMSQKLNLSRTLNIEAEFPCELSANNCDTKQRHIPEDRNFQLLRNLVRNMLLRMS
jgi:hypothetical protein